MKKQNSNPKTSVKREREYGDGWELMETSGRLVLLQNTANQINLVKQQSKYNPNLRCDLFEAVLEL